MKTKYLATVTLQLTVEGDDVGGALKAVEGIKLNEKIGNLTECKNIILFQLETHEIPPYFEGK